MDLQVTSRRSLSGMTDGVSQHRHGLDLDQELGPGQARNHE
jgi:hypothetical protein